MKTTDFVPLCDPETGVCALPQMEPQSARPAAEPARGEVLYVGDPMCSWCWGISPGLHQLEAEAQRRGVPFRILVGGLRPGGGDPWTDEFRSFLRHHWEEIAERSGQPFSTKFLDRPAFNYDTEPASRAFVVLRRMLEEVSTPSTRKYDVFAAIQRKFYADGEDPTVGSFYESICAEYGLDYAEFLKRFASPAARAATAQEFQEARALGVRSFPTVLFRDEKGIKVIAAGYATGPGMVEALGRVTEG